MDNLRRQGRLISTSRYIRFAWLNFDDGLPCMTYPETFLENIGADDNEIFHLVNEMSAREP